jgi:type III pantothenate kinase
MSKEFFLCIDIGNSLYKIAVFKSSRLIHFEQGTTLHLTAIKKIFYQYAIDQSILCQVKTIKESIKEYLKKHCQYLEMSAELTVPVKIRYLTPLTLGKDRLAAVCGAARLYSGYPVLVIGIGTCITYDILTANREYLGGNISPGLDMRLIAMHHYTARLPLAEKNLEVKFIGDNTIHALQSGALWGIQCELQGMISAYSKKYHKLKVVLGGGGADFYKNRLKKPIFAHPNLVILGLKEILSLNVQKT